MKNKLSIKLYPSGKTTIKGISFLKNSISLSNAHKFRVINCEYFGIKLRIKKS